MLMERDCTVYRASHTISLDKFKTPVSTFEGITFENLPFNVTQLTYSWIDPIKVREKIIAKNQKNVHFWIMPNQLVLCFGSSESSISHGIDRFCAYSGVNLCKLNLYEGWVTQRLRTDKWVANLVEVSVCKEPSPTDENSVRVMRNSELSDEELLLLINTSNIANLTFAWTQSNSSSYFHLDKNSVVSFYDTAKDEEILNVVTELSKYMENT